MSSILSILGLETATLTITARREARNGSGVKDGQGELKAPDAGPKAPEATPKAPEPVPKAPEPGETRTARTLRKLKHKLRHAVLLVPPVAVGLASYVSHQSYLDVFPCSGAGGGGGCTGALQAFRLDVDSLSLARGATLAAYDVSARFAWQSTLVLFLVVAALVAVIGVLLAYRAIDESRIRGAGWFVAGLIALAIIVFLIVYNLDNKYLLLTDMLLPLVDRALSAGENPFPAEQIENIQALFRAAAFTASGILVVAAGTTLLCRTDADALQEKEHLVSQWRRLKHALFAGAALLVSAVLFQAAFFGWAHALTTAVTGEIERDQHAVVARAAEAKAAAEGLKVDVAEAQDSLAGEVKRLGAAGVDTASAAGRRRLLPLRQAVGSLASRYSADSLQAHSLARALATDTAGVRIAAARVKAAEARIDQVTTAGVTQAGGLVNSVLLLVMYLPAALILMERARTLSHSEKPTETAREAWLKENGVAFTFWSQWTKALAVLAPALSSIPAAKLILEVFK